MPPAATPTDDPAPRIGRAIIATALSAGLGVLALPPAHLHPLALIAWIPLLFALRDIGPARGLLLGLGHGLLLFGGTLVWLFEIFGPAAGALIVIMAMFTALFGLLAGLLGRHVPRGLLGALLLAVLWTGIEYVRGEWFTLRFPWITPGTALAPGALTPWIGTYGVTFAIVFGGAWAAGWARGRWTPLVGLAVLAGLGATVALNPPAPPPTDPLRIAAIQGEVLPFDEYVDLSRQAPRPLDAIVWPEYALSSDLRTIPAQMAAVDALLDETGARLLIVGSRTDHPDGAWSNTAVLIGPDGVLGAHHKNRPVHFFDDGEPGTEARAFATPIGRVASPICFDNDYAPVPRQAVVDGAELLLVPSMDAEHWTARQHAQHAELFRHRAAENGRWVVVAASSGISQFIDPHGHRVAALTDVAPGILVGEVEARAALTPFTRFGWLLGPLCAALAALIALGLLFVGIRAARSTARPPSQTPSEAQ